MGWPILPKRAPFAEADVEVDAGKNSPYEKQIDTYDIYLGRASFFIFRSR